MYFFHILLLSKSFIFTYINVDFNKCYIVFGILKGILTLEDIKPATTTNPHQLLGVITMCLKNLRWAL